MTISNNTLSESESDSYFGSINTPDVIYLLIYGLFCAICYEFNLGLFLFIGVLFITILTSMKNVSLSMGYLVLSLNFTGELLSGAMYIALLVVILVIYSTKFRKGFLKFSLSNAILLFVSISIVSLSYISGIKTEINGAIIMMLCVIAYIVITECGDSLSGKYIALATIINGVCMCLCVLHQVILGGNYLKNGRLNFAENSKILAIGCAVPAILLICSWISDRALFKSNNKHTILKFFLTALYLTIILLTGSKGVFIGLIVSSLVFVLLSFRNKKSIIKAFAIVILLFAGFYFLSDNSMFRVSRLITSAGNENLTARFQIWDYYYSELKSHGLLTLALGFGPGNIKRIAEGSYVAVYYSHSTILDYLFTYGYIGLLAFCSFQISIIFLLVKHKNTIMITLYIMCMIVYSTHGGSGNLYLYVLEAFMIITTKFNNYRSEGNSYGFK